MLIVVLLTSISSALATAIAMLLAGFGLIMALVAAPFGGSTIALLTGAYLAHRRSAASTASIVPVGQQHRHDAPPSQLQ